MGYAPGESLGNSGLLLSILLTARLLVYDLRNLLDGGSIDLLYLLTARLSRSAADQEQHHQKEDDEQHDYD
jgi:hypothetical protein